MRLRKEYTGFLVSRLTGEYAYGCVYIYIYRNRAMPVRCYMYSVRIRRLKWNFLSLYLKFFRVLWTVEGRGWRYHLSERERGWRDGEWASGGGPVSWISSNK